MGKNAALQTLAFAFFLFAVSGLTAADVRAQGRSFYEGKSIRLIVFGSPGGGNDLWARLLARYMPEHLPGRPQLVVQNMPGAAGMIATNYLYNVAKADGLTIGLIAPALYQAQVIGRPEAKFDWAKFGWIGTPETSAYQVFIRADAGYRSLDDVRKASQPPPCAESSIGSMNYAFNKLIGEVFEAKFQSTLGYRGSGEMNAAVQRGEAVCRSTTVSTLLTTQPPREWLKTGFIRVLVQSGRERHPALADVPTVWELAEKYRVGKEDRQLMRLVLAAAAFGRPFVAPPGVPEERLELLREAFLSTTRDPNFVKVATKAGFEVSPVSGAELDRLAKELAATSPAAVQRLKKLLE